MPVNNKLDIETVTKEVISEIDKFLSKVSALKQAADWQLKAEMKLTKDLQKMFGAAFNKTLSKLKGMQSVPASGPQRKALLSEIENLKDKFGKTVGAAAIDAENIGRLRTGALTEFAIGDFSKQYSRLISDHTFEASQRTMDRMIGGVMDNLNRSYEQGLGINDAAEELRSKFSSMQDYELKRIARTEIQSHQNEGAHNTIVESGCQYEQWWTAEDERVRGNNPKDIADHISMHGQIVRVGDPFSNGLMYPGDRSGPIEEIINCRCRTVPFIMPEGCIAPSGVNYFYEDDLIEISDLVKMPEEEGPQLGEAETRTVAETIEEQRPVFYEAKTKSEAEEYARNFSKGDISYRGLDINVANDINKALYDCKIGDEIPKLDGIYTKAWGKKSSFARYEVVNNRLAINTSIMKNQKTIDEINKLGEDSFRLLKQNYQGLPIKLKIKYADYYQAERSLVRADNATEIIMHELGHHIDYSLIQKDKELLKIIDMKRPNEFAKLSGYAGYSRSEFIAESFTAYRYGEADKVIPELVKYFKEMGL
jgi:SPP1 gp7 family putative phage head morphogenesis protein